MTREHFYKWSRYIFIFSIFVANYCIWCFDLCFDSNNVNFSEFKRKKHFLMYLILLSSCSFFFFICLAAVGGFTGSLPVENPKILYFLCVFFLSIKLILKFWLPQKYFLLGKISLFFLKFWHEFIFSDQRIQSLFQFGLFLYQFDGSMDFSFFLMTLFSKVVWVIVNGEIWFVNKDEVRGVNQDSLRRNYRRWLVVCYGCGCNCKQRVLDC